MRDCPTPSRADIGETADVIYAAMRGSADQHRIHVNATPVAPQALPPSPTPAPTSRPAAASAGTKPKKGKKAKGKKRSPKQAIWVLPGKDSRDPASRSTAEEAIRERRRRTRERWAEEARQRPAEVDHHHHHHHFDDAPSGEPGVAGSRVHREPVSEDDNIIEAEIIEDDGAHVPPGALGAEPGRALPPGSPSDLGFRVRPNQEQRRHDR